MIIFQNIKTIALASTLGLLLAMSACSPKVDAGGYVSEEETKEKVHIGKSSKEDVRTNLGSPSFQSTFGDETWYYVTTRKEGRAFLKPEVVQQDVMQISFDANGTVKTVENYTKNDGADISIAKRTTPTEGHTMGFFEQVLGNIGRFNHPSNDSIAPGRRPGS